MKIELYDSVLNAIVLKPQWLAKHMLSTNHIKDGKRYCLKSEMSDYVHFAPSQQPAKRGRKPQNINENNDQ